MFSQIVLQILLGTLVPLALLAANQLWRFSEAKRRVMYVTACLLTWSHLRHAVERVIGGQLFSKSFLGYTTYKVSFAAREACLPPVA